MSEVRLEGVVKRYPSPEGEIEVLGGVNLVVKRGEAVSIMGPSGSGKTTLLHIIGTLLRPSGGRVFLEGQEVSSMEERDLAFFRNRKIGFVFQFHHLLPEFTVLENVMMPLIIRGGTGAEGRARRVLEMVGMSHRLKFKPAQLSGGEKQRVALARALVNNPSLLLADEPTGNLDWRSSRQLMDVLSRLHAQLGFTLIIVTHNREIAEKWGKIYLLERGKLKCCTD